MKLSIIVPVYNVEQYLVRCLESIVVEMRDDYELILVDDGSTDRSGEMCDDFAHQHPGLNVVVVHQPNGGLSAARNAGIDRARGEYITFVDSDDYIDSYSLVHNMEFLAAHPEVDMLEYPVEVHAESSEAHVLTFADETQCADIFTDWVLRGGYKHCYACNKVFRARVWEKLRFPMGVYFEDVAIMPDVIRECRCIHYSSKGCYRYIAHVGSITTSYRYVKFRQLFGNNHRLFLTIKDVAALHSESMILWAYCLNQLVDMGRCVDVDKVDYKEMIRVAEVSRPSYRALLGTLLKSSKSMRHLKLLPLPLVGLAAYLRLYTAFASTLR